MALRKVLKFAPVSNLDVAISNYIQLQVITISITFAVSSMQPFWISDLYYLSVWYLLIYVLCVHFVYLCMDMYMYKQTVKRLIDLVYFTFSYIIPFYLNVQISVWTLMFIISSQNMKQGMKGTFGSKVFGINLYNLSPFIMVKNTNPRTNSEKIAKSFSYFDTRIDQIMF